MPQLDTVRLSFAYDGHQRHPFTLQDVTATIRAGAITGLLGPNGSGKSTFLKLVAGVLPPTSGQVLLDGQPVSVLPRRHLARRVALVPQSTHPAFDCTALELVLMGRHPHMASFALEGPADLAAARAAMDATRTRHLADRQFLTLSGGEQQRVALASALAQASEVLLLDEPTASLDLGFQVEIADLLRELNREHGTTMVVATHDLSFAARVCDQVLLMRDGRLLASGPPTEVLTPDTLRALYDVDAHVVPHAETGVLMVVPARRTGGPRR